jgi:hypothetical protein
MSSCGKVGRIKKEAGWAFTCTYVLGNRRGTDSQVPVDRQDDRKKKSSFSRVEKGTVRKSEIGSENTRRLQAWLLRIFKFVYRLEYSRYIIDTRRTEIELISQALSFHFDFLFPSVISV